MNCSGARSLLPALADGSLPESSRLPIQNHVEGCPSCTSFVERRLRLRELLRASMPTPDPGEPFFLRQRARILTPVAGEPQALVWGRMLGAVAMMAAAVLILLLNPMRSRRQLPPEPSVVAERSNVAPSSPPPSDPVRSTPESATAPVTPAPSPSKTDAPPAGEPIAPTVSHPPQPPAARPGPPAGTAERTLRMTKEATEVALAETPSERVAALCNAAEAQLRELPKVMGKDPVLAAELASAYRLLVLEGLGAVLKDKTESEADLQPARDIAARRTREHEAMLLGLSGGTAGTLQENLDLALAASRSFSGR